MPYSAREQIDKSDYYRAHAGEQGYVRELKDRDLAIEIENVTVDVRELVKRRFVCDTLLCVKKKKSNGSAEYSGSCCTDLVVHLSPYEAEKIYELYEKGNEVKEEFPADVQKVIDRVLDNNYTYENDEHELCLQDKGNNTCSLSFIDKETGALFCSINTICSKLNLDLGEFKAIPCIDFPVHVCEYEPDKLLLTLMAPRNFKCLGGSEEVVDLVCIRKPPKDAPVAYQFLKDTIINRFGEEFYNILDEKAQKYL